MVFIRHAIVQIQHTIVQVQMLSHRISFLHDLQPAMSTILLSVHLSENQVSMETGISDSLLKLFLS